LQFNDKTWKMGLLFCSFFVTFYRDIIKIIIFTRSTYVKYQKISFFHKTPPGLSDLQLFSNQRDFLDSQIRISPVVCCGSSLSSLLVVKGGIRRFWVRQMAFDIFG